MGKKDICAYCDQPFDGKRTREHIIPNWYTADSNGITFNERNLKKLDIQSDIVIKDVCSNCNGGALSQLDNYGKELYEKYFHNPIFFKEKIRLNFDYQCLLKWLLKISYNSARVNDSDVDILKQYRTYIINENPLPSQLQLFLRPIAPSKVNPDGKFQMAKRFDSDIHVPEIFRVGVASFKGLEKIFWAKRTITINSFRFIIFIPHLDEADFKNDPPQIIKTIAKLDKTFTLLNNRSTVKTKPPSTDFLSDIQPHYLNNPIAVGRHLESYSDDEEARENEKLLEKIHEQKIDIFHFIIAREDIEAGNVLTVLSNFLPLLATRENVLKYWGKSEFSIFGYDEDPRELFQIPSVRIFLEQINTLFPYWLAFQSEKGTWIKTLFFCLNDVEIIENKIHIKSNREDIFFRWYQGLNEITEKFALPLNRNRTQSELLNKIIFNVP